MDDKDSMESYLIGRKTELQAGGPARASIVPEWLKTLLLLVLVLLAGYLLYDSYNYQKASQAQMALLEQRLQALERMTQEGSLALTDLRGEIIEAQQAVGSTKAELKKTAQQIQLESEKARAELGQAIAAKADQHMVQAIKQETESKIGQVTSEVGGVKTEVVAVKSDLANTKRDLEGTQRQLIDVKETLSAAVAKNAAELEALRRKGERDYIEFTIPKRNVLTKVEDIRLILTKTDPKKGKYTVQIVVDDNKLEKKDRTINEPIQFLVGRNLVRYELVFNWVQKDSGGGYLSIPKEKTVAAERAAP